MPTETVLRSSGVVTTILGVINQFHSFTNLKYQALFDTTLNSKYGVLNSAEYQKPKYAPTLKYYGIGVRGFQNINLEQGAVPNPGDARCMDLYRPIPIRVIRSNQLNTVLPLPQRNEYRMHQRKNIGGVDYDLFFLKVIKFNPTVEIVKKDASGTTSRYDLNPGVWLEPEPPDLNQIGGSIQTNTNRIVVRATGECSISHDEIMEAVTVMFNGDMNYARISEIGYYTGYDVLLDSEGHDIETLDSATYGSLISQEDSLEHEAAYVQLAKHHCFRGCELFTQGSYMNPKVALESECCINEG